MSRPCSLQIDSASCAYIRTCIFEGAKLLQNFALKIIFSASLLRGRLPRARKTTARSTAMVPSSGS